VRPTKHPLSERHPVGRQNETQPFRGGKKEPVLRRRKVLRQRIRARGETFCGGSLKSWQRRPCCNSCMSPRPKASVDRESRGGIKRQQNRGIVGRSKARGRLIATGKESQSGFPGLLNRTWGPSHERKGNSRRRSQLCDLRGEGRKPRDYHDPKIVDHLLRRRDASRTAGKSKLSKGRRQSTYLDRRKGYN